MNVVPDYYLSEEVVNSTSWFYPHLMWALPRELRWDYTKRFELAILTRVCEATRSHLLDQSDGFDPTHDASMLTLAGDIIKAEIKATLNHKLFIEVGRYDFTPSGVSATDAHIYITIAQNTNNRINEPTTMRKAKVRIYSTYMLAQKYNPDFEKVYQPNGMGPGGRGVLIDPMDVRDAWVGDLESKVDTYGNVMYNTESFVVKNPSAAEHLLREVRLIYKFDERYNKDIEE